MDELFRELQAALADGYTIERELRGGGMARVFVAEERALGRRVVIKVLAPDLAAGVSADRFTREIRLTAKLQHPQIVPVLAAGLAVGLPYYVMPYIEGESLRDHLARTGPLPIGMAVGILRDVAKALDFAHARGVVHRDIKPGNILLTGESATVADFGIGKALSASATTADGTDALTGVGLAVGTPAYMAPEQAAGDASTDQRADLYALGVLGYEMLTGTSPFAGRPPRETIVAVLTEAPASISARRPDAPVALVTLLTRCLAKDPGQRPQSATELLAALDYATTSGASPVARVPARRARIGAAAGAVLLVAVGVFAMRASSARGVKEPAASGYEYAIAVLPCANVANDTAAEYFVDGITGELIGRLAKVPGLRVTPRASSLSLRGKGLELAEIGQRLRVGTIVECTIRRLGPNVRVTADLVDLKGERTLWAGTFEGALQGIVGLQDSIAQGVMVALRLQLAGSSAHPRGPADTATYLMYLKGRYLWNQRTPDAMHRGIVMLESAVARDPSFAPAWAELANAYSLAPAFANDSPSTSAPRARAAANRAIQLDSSLAQAQVALGIISTFYDRDYPRALELFDAASRLDARDANAKLFRTWALVAQGRLDEALVAIREARQLDPLAQIINTRVATVLKNMRRFPEAEVEARHALELDSTNMIARFELAHVLVQQGRYPEAFAAFPPNAMELAQVEVGLQLGKLGYAFAMAGRRAEALECKRRLEDRSRTAYVSPFALAFLAAGLGDRAALLHQLELGERQRVPYLIFVGVDPEFYPYRDEPRYRALVARVAQRAPTL